MKHKPTTKFIADFARHEGISKYKARSYVRMFTRTIKKIIAEGDEVWLHGIIRMQPKYRASTIKSNPKTRKLENIPSQWRVYAQVSKQIHRLAAKAKANDSSRNQIQ
jgi:nucleoid DNA-binding protein